MCHNLQAPGQSASVYPCRCLQKIAHFADMVAQYPCHLQSITDTIGFLLRMIVIPSLRFSGAHALCGFMKPSSESTVNKYLKKVVGLVPLSPCHVQMQSAVY